MKQITKKQYQKIKSLEKKFYKGVDKYCEDLQDTYDFTNPFKMIMEIIDNAKET